VTGSPDEYFLEAYKIKPALFVHGQMILKFLGCLVKQRIRYNVSACLHLFILKTVPTTGSNFCSGFLFLLMVDFLLCTYIHGRISEQFSGSQAAFKTTFRVTSGSQKARQGF
jgi:hypothetical protein